MRRRIEGLYNPQIFYNGYQMGGIVCFELNAEFVKALNTAEVKAKFAAIGGDPAPMTLVEANTFLNSEIARWGEVVNAMGPMAN